MTPWTEAFTMQAEACRNLGSPLTARVCEALVHVISRSDPSDSRAQIANRVKSWPGDATWRADSVPLRLCGALHGLVLEGLAPDLARIYATPAQFSDTALEAEISSAFQHHAGRIDEWLNHPPQTNEVGRSAALIAACWFLAERCPGVDFIALELGASAGLNLNFRYYHIDNIQKHGGVSGVSLSPEWRSGMPTAHPSNILDARGVDLNPLDPAKDGLRLLAYIWADQHARIARMRAALNVAAQHPPKVARADAANWLEEQLARDTPKMQGRLVYHTIAAQYFPQSTLHSIEKSLNSYGSRATDAAPLAHVSLENGAGNQTELRLRLWTSGGLESWLLARSDAHVRWIDWQPAKE